MYPRVAKKKTQNSWLCIHGDWLTQKIKIIKIARQKRFFVSCCLGDTIAVNGIKEKKY